MKKYIIQYWDINQKTHYEIIKARNQEKAQEKFYKKNKNTLILKTSLV